jgi:hypothetical protein
MQEAKPKFLAKKFLAKSCVLSSCGLRHPAAQTAPTTACLLELAKCLNLAKVSLHSQNFFLAP